MTWLVVDRSELDRLPILIWGTRSSPCPSRFLWKGTDGGFRLFNPASDVTQYAGENAVPYSAVLTLRVSCVHSLRTRRLSSSDVQSRAPRPGRGTPYGRLGSG